MKKLNKKELAAFIAALSIATGVSIIVASGEPFYKDFKKTNTSGLHSFQGVVITSLIQAGFPVAEVTDHPDGKIINFGGKNAVLHKNQQPDTTDLTKAVVQLPIEDLADMQDEIQSILLLFEKTPTGTRQAITP